MIDLKNTKPANGPWAINPGGTTAGRSSILIVDADGHPVAEARKQYKPSGRAVAETDIARQVINASLIAAAPDLLAAAAAALQWFESHAPRMSGPILAEAMLRAAIAKAEGRAK